MSRAGDSVESRNGAEEVESFLDIRVLSSFPGYKMFSPKASHLCGRMQGCAKRLSFLQFGDEYRDHIRGLSQVDRAKAARMLSSGLTTAKNIFADAEAIRIGFDPLNVATLKGWTRHPGCPVRLYVDSDRGNFYIGASESQQVRIELPGLFWRPLGGLPAISTDLS